MPDYLSFNSGIRCVINSQPSAIGFCYCPADTSVDHKGFFTIEADKPLAASKFFGQMAVEVRSVQPLSEVAKKL
jgi:hypothetical protein